MVSKAKINNIKATSRISTQIQGVYYTLEYSEERLIPEDANIEEERAILWDVVNNEVDNQIADIEKIANNYRK